MSREQMLEEAARAALEARYATLSEWRWDRVAEAKRTEARRQAEAVLDVILPQVSTVAELEALPKGSRLLAADGTTWQRYYTGSWLSDQNLTRTPKTLFAMKKTAPLTVIWQPEVTA